MNKTYAIIIILILIAGGIYFAMDGRMNSSLDGVQNTNVNGGDGGTTPTPSPTPGTVACTMDAKLCPDGSYVGRVGPNCEFALCPGANTGTLKEFTVTGTNFAFSPSTITVKKGDRVKITFQNTQGFHDFVIDEYGVATKQATSPATEVIEFTADKTGTFEYYCSVGSHRAMGMKGTLKVE